MKGLVVVGIVFAVLAAGVAAVLLLWQPWAGGIEFEYALILPPGAPARETGEQVARVLERRAGAFAIDSKATATGDGRVGIRLAGMNLPDAAYLRGPFAQRGRLELLLVADRETQERYNADGKLPAGYRVGQPPPMPAAREYAPWSKGAVLLVDPPIVVTADVARARPDAAQLPGGVAWHVAVELHPEAAARFDAAATRLYSLNPPGMVAIVVDGRIVSMPSIRSDKFGGNLVIAGAKDQDECRTWAFALSGGELPCLLRELDVRNYRGKLRR